MASDYTYTLTVNSEATTQTGTPSENFKAVVRVPAAASDLSLTLGLLTDPVFVSVVGGAGISFKITGGTDAIGANPCALIANEDGLGISTVLLSNSSAVEVEVTVQAAE